jgi:hypothetical protein
MLGFLSDCFVGTLALDVEPHKVKYGMVMEGLADISVTGMGDGLVLLKSTSQENLEAMIEAHCPWWNSIFKDFKRWSPQLVAKRRLIRLNIFGIPLHA